MRILNARTIMRSLSGFRVCMSYTSNQIRHKQNHVVRGGFQRVQALFGRGFGRGRFRLLALKFRLFFRRCVPVDHAHHGHLYLHGLVPCFADDATILRIFRFVVDYALFGARGNLFILCDSHALTPYTSNLHPAGQVIPLDKFMMFISAPLTASAVPVALHKRIGLNALYWPKSYK